MLPAYYKHVQDFKNTLVTKFYGLHCVKLTGTTQKKVMREIFNIILKLKLLSFDSLEITGAVCHYGESVLFGACYSQAIRLERFFPWSNN